MDRIFGRSRFTSKRVKGVPPEGYEGYELFQHREGEEAQRVASVVYWDATGHYWVEMFGTVVPLEVLEELVAETKANVRFA